jgi:acetylornithine/succinyldiaminopimelate/putrescine aminotransferase
MKLAKRFTGRKQILAFENAYHGSTQGALSIYGGNELNKSVQPLLPEIAFMRFNDIQSLELISEKTACVILEVIQSEAGIIWAKPEFIIELAKKCKATGTLLVIDEVQTGMGRTENYLLSNISTLYRYFARLMLWGGMPLVFFCFKNNDGCTHV